jgi:hypothetical protein
MQDVAERVCQHHGCAEGEYEMIVRQLTRQYSILWHSHEAQHAGMSRENAPQTVAFVHIPKCGGMGVRKWLFKSASAAHIRSFVPCFNQLSCYAYFGDLPVKMRQRNGLVAGHMPFGLVSEPIVQLPDSSVGEGLAGHDRHSNLKQHEPTAISLVLLREPGQRMVSLFHYMKVLPPPPLPFPPFLPHPYLPLPPLLPPPPSLPPPPTHTSELESPSWTTPTSTNVAAGRPTSRCVLKPRWRRAICRSTSTSRL